MKTTLYLSAIKASKQVLIAGLASFLPLFFEEIKKRSPLLHHFSINVDIIYCVLSNNMCIILKKNTQICLLDNKGKFVFEYCHILYYLYKKESFSTFRFLSNDEALSSLFYI